jgi:hypothetical protein
MTLPLAVQGCWVVGCNRSPSLLPSLLYGAQSRQQEEVSVMGTTARWCSQRQEATCDVPEEAVKL